MRTAHRRAAVLVTAMAACAALVTGGASPAAPAPATPVAHGVPRTVVLDGARLHRTKVRLEHGDARLRRAARALTARADTWLGQGP